METNKAVAKPKHTTRELLRVAHENTGWLMALVVFAAIIGSGVGIGTPIITQKFYDHYIPDEDGRMIGIMTGTMAGLVLFAGIGVYISGYFGMLLQNKVEYSIRRQSFNHMQRVGVSYIDRKNEGHFITRINEDARNISMLVRYLPENIVSSLALSGAAFTMVFMYNAVIGGALIGIFVTLMLFTFLVRKKFRASWLRVRETNEKVTSILVNSVSGVKESKIYKAEERESEKFWFSLGKLQQQWKSNFRLYAKWMTFNTFILSMITVIILGVGAWQVTEDNMSEGEVVASMMYAAQITGPINKLLATFDIIVTAQASLRRVLDFWNVEQERYGEGVELPEEIEGGIEFKNVSFEYVIENEALDKFDEWQMYKKNTHVDHEVILERKQVLHDISFKIKPGEKVAFVGETGAGKSTILKLILRFYEISGGSISIDGQDIHEAKLEDVRHHISYLQQEPYIFYDSVVNNVAFAIGDTDMSDEEKEKQVREALRVAHADKFVEELPKGIHQNIGPRGISLSGGQKQRIAISRAVLKNSQIILFDEATSALDNETEKEIQKEINELAEGKTAIFIAHRLTTIKDLDKIFVLKEGRIVETGTHKELLNQKGYYYKLNKVVE